jgi:hypothetical protein
VFLLLYLFLQPLNLLAELLNWCSGVALWGEVLMASWGEVLMASWGEVLMFMGPEGFGPLDLPEIELK